MDNTTVNNSTVSVSSPLVLAAAARKWTPSLIGQGVILALSLFSNIIVFIEFIRIPSRVTPFTVYLLVLLGTNVAFLCIVPLTEMLNELYGQWWMGRAWCDVHNYFNNVVSGAQICVHMTISINRLWAVHHPISYRNKHNKTVALLTCLVAIAFANIVGLPGVILDVLYYSIDLKYGCHINYTAQAAWGKAQQALLHLFPWAVIIVSYVHLCINRVNRRRRTQDQMSHDSQKAAIVSTTPEHRPVVLRQNEAVKPFLVLSLTAISVTICWTPAIIYFAAIIFFGLWMPATFFIAAVTFYSMQALFDPWLFALGLFAVKKNWRFLHCCN
ncbi:alpha-2B adrenergic receptor-like [Paramacrobiotus metropolitanus]|uniref:alpha-2B adrenergic receptor-like n=1 Tax=Paramacrobiotus metropolitanus TaxID=2943436 RepID=UPI002445A886|nr:alpha-2B adrenergic receptor-like [Paramacrobiotus metropolitanus]XP_055346123.1 alpha-2B adrenergic receptor-like [Paramacrobiotus metropolitanus]XP_055346124.1 alpha-2B adrenergic receptor-like [Paramacrobiotus metropolitanus]XP_055346126.1 alpha-2B adrenergic receptor-like [Paramacrobiotus metropolitanus]